MSSFGSISVDRLSRLVGTHKCPAIVDVRTDEDFQKDPRLLPIAVRRQAQSVAAWAHSLAGGEAVVVCQRGAKLSQGAAAWLRVAKCDAVVLEGGFEAWKAAALPLVPKAKLPEPGADGRSVWVTRARPKVDRIACPWLIRRFVDRDAVFLFVAASDVAGVTERFEATPFDVEGVEWSHRGELCTFDVMVEELGLSSEAMGKLATIVRAADTARLDLSPQAAGLLAISLGLSRMYQDDLAQLEAGMRVYDALYRWCRDATDEVHNWPTNKPRG
jgi:rhodanese-related sulfurtransferase